MVKNPPTEKIDALFADYDKPDSPGCALGIVKDGALVYQRGYGMADLAKGEAIDPAKSRFYIASVSKQFTAACALLLARRGAVSLDDDVRRYFPELPAYEHTVTLRHLMHHTSGLKCYLDLWWMAGRKFEGPLGNADGMDILAKQRELNFAPGAEFTYCNSGYKLLAELVPRVTGLTLRQFAERELFAPLGMRDTFFDDDNAAIDHRVASYRPAEEGGFRAIPKEFTIVGSGGLVTTVGDLYRWDQNFYHARVGGPEFVEQMQTRGRFNDGRDLPYAAGLFVRDYKGLRIVHHGGVMLGFRAFFGRFPAQRLSVILLGNLSTIDFWAKAGEVLDLYLADAYRLGPFAGAYYNEDLRATCRFVSCAGDLYAWRDEQRYRLATTDTDEFQIPGTTFRFERGAAGQVVACTISTDRARAIRFEKQPTQVRVRRRRRCALVPGGRRAR